MAKYWKNNIAIWYTRTVKHKVGFCSQCDQTWQNFGSGAKCKMFLDIFREFIWYYAKTFLWQKKNMLLGNRTIWSLCPCCTLSLSLSLSQSHTNPFTKEWSHFSSSLVMQISLSLSFSSVARESHFFKSVWNDKSVNRLKKEREGNRNTKHLGTIL